ncbi:MAG: HlyD family efflux transporter periplasmic adaptor subunit [Candidatus Thiodiazotropha sp. (ex Dulcina madagascariensis)]|nr:HlyD family efflux transporter periplasmic adaptor subunit [Candidatus Thiodiazotropha sp. (ex Dulcina madagascariensis)]MCU7928590.1 HlyD family efflux transporter periplasmic adaptor subunit [Candidatus Thiodiazotropha sp. (ex Dulcina madagascariensis)]
MRLSTLLFILLCYLMALPVAHAADSLVTARPALQREVHSGFTRARTRLVLSAEEAGRIERVNADVGDRIAPDQPFACQDETFINLELRTNQAEREALEVDMAYYRKEVARYRQLLKQNSSSESQLDAAQRNLDKTRTQLDALAIAAQTLRERKQRLCINAPAGWLVIKRFVEPGEWVNTGEPAVEVGDYSRLVAPFALSVVEYQALIAPREGLKVRLPELQIEVPASLLRVSPAFDEVSRKIHLELEIADGLVSPRGGLRVELGLDIPLRTGAVLVPQRALRQRYEQYWLKRPDGEEIRVVYLGRANTPDSDWVRVASPAVKAGDQFQLNGE